MYLPTPQTLKNSKWKVYTRPFELNIVGVRSPSLRPNKFDDIMVVFYYDDKGKLVYLKFPCTTDTGTYWLKNPMMPQGTAIVQEGQYIDAYQLGFHRGQYKALVQVKPVSIRRDNNRDDVLDFFAGKIYKDNIGANIHHASSNGTTKFVDKYSAGCQVFANIEDYDYFISLCDKHKSLYGNSFTYGLIDARMQQRTVARRTITALGALALAAVYNKEITDFLGLKN
ncbi:hypothetical protein ACE193_15175 [Bernardetia sp. OM2101]|uniref:hypothetical protein n=1 Tax=Bernardetia sp. OM2101 TaxID=3344876 RepID=UPI0035CEADCE